MIKEKLSELLSKGQKLKLSESCKMQVSGGMTDYDSYQFNIIEIAKYVVTGLLCDGLFSYIFYRSVVAFVFLLPIVIFVLKKKNNECIIKRKQKLVTEFREMMNSVIANLGAGYSIENAFINAYRDMVLLFGKNANISKEIEMMAKALKNNRNLEELLDDFGRRSHISDIKDFAEIFKIAKRSGGNLPEIIKSTADVINEKIEVKRKIETIISAKKFEQSIMNVVPFGIIMYLDITSPGFFDGLYHNLTGVAIMTALLIIYLLAYFIAEKITTINV